MPCSAGEKDMIILGDFNLGPEENGKNKQLNSLDIILDICTLSQAFRLLGVREGCHSRKNYCEQKKKESNLRPFDY